MSGHRWARAASTHPQTAAQQAVDLHACALEPIHRPDAIQPHGVLFVLSSNDYTVTHVSANVAAYLQVQIDAVLGACIFDLVCASGRQKLYDILQTDSSSTYNPLKLTFHAGSAQRSFDAIMHRHGGHLFLELEPTLSIESRAFVSFFQDTREAMTSLRESANLTQLCDNVVKKVRGIIDFDRVLIYQFDKNWDGKVIAESRSPTTRSFLGYHFPESDIPAQARRLYMTSTLRWIPDTFYEPSPIIPLDKTTHVPLDMSRSVLRSISPLSQKYSQDMGVSSSMSISLIYNEKLWGLMICAHFNAVKSLSYETRTSCEFLCEVFTSLIGAKEAVDEARQRRSFKECKQRLIEQMFADQDVVHGLLNHPVHMGQICGAHGAAIVQGEVVHSVGLTLSAPAIKALCRWLSQNTSQGDFVTDRLPESRAPVDAIGAGIFGVVALPLSGAQHSFLLWFRSEDCRQETWGGKPYVPSSASVSTRSFDPIVQAKRHRSLPWLDVELEAIQDLVRAVVDIVLQHMERLEEVNSELQQSNNELNAFAYAASHDLKEPLRGIAHFSQLVIDELGPEHLIGQSHYRMVSIQRMAGRMDALIDALLRYAHVGRSQLEVKQVVLDELFVQIKETLESRLEAAGAQLVVDAPMPTVLGDAVLLSEVFTNLITNAIKYNSSKRPMIHVGSRPASKADWVELFVSDNGIGIDIKHSNDVFDIFRRLHAREKYGGGSGAGLTIAKRIVERHGGQLTFTSQYGMGTTFYFRLRRAAQ